MHRESLPTAAMAPNMSALTRWLRLVEGRAAHLSSPLGLKIGLWVLVLAWSSSITFQWLQDASAILPPPGVTEPRLAIDLDEAIAQAAAAPLFGEAPESGTIATAIAAPLDIKLKGVFAGAGGPMAAIVDTGGEEDEFVMLGRELRRGVVLEGIHPTHIIVGRDGVSHLVELEAVKSEASRSKGATPASGTRAAHSPPAVPSTTEAEAPSPPAETESSTPLAPPMPQSDAGPSSLFRAA